MSASRSFDGLEAREKRGEAGQLEDLAHEASCIGQPQGAAALLQRFPDDEQAPDSGTAHVLEPAEVNNEHFRASSDNLQARLLEFRRGDRVHAPACLHDARSALLPR